MNDKIEEFLNHLAHERRLSSHTVRSYGQDLNHFYNYLIVKLKTKDVLGLITHYHLRDYLSYCFDNLKNVSIARRLSAIRSFFRYMVRNDYIKSSPADLIDNPKVTKPLPKPVSVDEAFSLCDTQKEEGSIMLRNRLIVELLYASGIRVSELCSLNVEDVDLDNKLMRVLGKGKKERIVPIHQLAATLCEKWLRYFRAQFLKSGDNKALFLGKRGERIDQRVVRAILYSLSEELSINKRVHPHRLRHAYATHMLESGADLRSIQELLGHKTIATTERYTEIDLASLMKQYDKAHPHAKKNKKKNDDKH